MNSKQGIGIFSSNFKLTSTPHRSPIFYENSKAYSQDAGYSSTIHSDASCFYSSFLSDDESQIFPTSFETEDSIIVRKSLRGKHRFDLLSAFIYYDMLNIVENVLMYLSYFDRLNTLKVCKSWKTLRNRFSRLFVPLYEQKFGKENFTISIEKVRCRNRKPLGNIPTIDVKSQNVSFSGKEFLHACPVCSGLAFYRPNEWPNRLHCQAADCGIAVCFNCYREHSPSDYCTSKNTRLSKRFSPIRYISTSPKRHSPRSKTKREKLLLRRL